MGTSVRHNYLNYSHCHCHCKKLWLCCTFMYWNGNRWCNVLEITFPLFHIPPLLPAMGRDVLCRISSKQTLKLLLPAAVVTLIIIFFQTANTEISESIHMEYNLIQIIPYIFGFNWWYFRHQCFFVLLIGIVSGSIIMLSTGATEATSLLANMGSGAAGMYETAMVAVLVSIICALIQEYNGFTALLTSNGYSKIIKAEN